ncbi:hypothetical protein ACD661_16290 [Legionella lytica]|uniref:Outer membrane protein beta-barrel domain-containing protein n=1 Tax=Legionella lytica TaxID=96232 RepID=A0ABW8DBN2_9GAMM
MNFIIKSSVVTLLGVLSMTQVQAKINNAPEPYTPWHINASMGLQSTLDAEAHHGESAIGRLSFEYMPIQYLGVELGIQSGNAMRFTADKETIDTLGGVGIEGRIKPMIDVLLTVKSPNISSALPLYATAKAGVAYRQLQLDRESINDVSQTKPEFQAGLGYRANSHLEITLTYQYLCGGNPKIRANPLTESGHISNIPIQRALLLGLTYTLG